MMRDYQNNEIEIACTGVGVALARLFTAVNGSIDAGRLTSHPLRTHLHPDILDDHPENGDGVAVLTPSATRAPRLSSSASHQTSPAEHQLFVYCAGSRGLADVARAHGPKIMAALGIAKRPYVVKCGTTTLALPTRLEQIGSDQYGAAIRSKKGIEFEPGFTAWIAHAIATSRPPCDSAVTLMPRSIAVNLPSGLTRRTFDRCLQRALAERALDTLPTTTMPRRLVAYDLVETRVGVARELYAICPHDHADGDWLLGAIEGVLSRFRTERS